MNRLLDKISVGLTTPRHSQSPASRHGTCSELIDTKLSVQLVACYAALRCGDVSASDKAANHNLFKSF